MKVMVVSDLHFEHTKDGGQGIVDLIDPTAGDILVVAGDLCSVRYLGKSLDMVARKCAEIPVLFVNGNHEGYGGTRNEMFAEIIGAERRNENLHWLNHETFEHMGRNFIGTTLWFRDVPWADARWFSDFISIKDGREWIFEANRRSLSFLDTFLSAEDVLITHHMPSNKSVAPEFKDADNRFFVCDIEDLILERKPALAIHGHTHNSFDYMLGTTRVVCNPHGYPRERAQQGPYQVKIVEIPNGAPSEAPMSSE